MVSQPRCLWRNLPCRQLYGDRAFQILKEVIFFEVALQHPSALSVLWRLDRTLTKVSQIHQDDGVPK